MIGRVLFVDAERTFLRELEPALRSTRGDWSIVVAMSSAEALDQLSRHTFDAVVASVETPGPEGGSFLHEVAARQPAAARFLLSRESGPEMLLRADDAAHQHLAPSLSAGDLFARLKQTLLLDRLLSDPGLKALVSRLKAVPSPTPLYLGLMSELQKEEASSRKIGELVSRDGGMSAKLLQLVNSPFFGLRMRVVDAAHAVRLLGLDTLRALVLSLHVFEQADARVSHRFRLGKVWRHSLAAAGYAKLIAYLQDGSPETIGEAFSAALLHDIGKLVLAGSLPEDYAFVIEQAEADSVPTWMVEQELLQATHAEVGAYLLGLWGVPGAIVEAVARHHRPSSDATPSYFPLGAVHVANVIEHQAHPGDVLGGPSTIDDAYLEGYQIAGQLPVWTAACQTLESGGA